MPSQRIIHFEIPANEPEKLTQFYAGVFGWTFEKANVPGPEYWLVRTGEGPGIDGGIMQRQHPQQPWTNYVGVPSIEAAIAEATKRGATVALPKTAIPGMGAYAAIVDPQGNIVGLWEMAG